NQPTRKDQTEKAREAAARFRAETKAKEAAKPKGPSRREMTAKAREAAAKRNVKKKPNTPLPKVQKHTSSANYSRAQKTWAAREDAARRNAQMATRPPVTQQRDDGKSRLQKTLEAREASRKFNSASYQSAQKQGAAPKANSKGAAARRPASGKVNTKKANQAESRQNIKRKTDPQTPKSRKEVRNRKKVSGSAKNIEIKLHNQSSRTSFRVKKRKNKAIGKLLMARLLLFFVVFAIMFSLVAGVFMLSLHSGGKNTGSEYTLQLGADLPEGVDKSKIPEEEKPKYLTVPKSCSRRYGNLYMPVSALTDFCQLTVTGTPEDLRYLPRESEGQSVRFLVDSDIAYVNGAKVRMISPSFIHEGKLYVPLDFIQKYSTGLVIEQDESAGKITVTKMIEGYDAVTDSDIQSALTFNLSVTTPLESIPEE
ncbi:MAG: hypothetical protein IKU19_09355, partial [Clostridia bacterium]|nr:hypothetical protein [Clostridia bacterium]